MNAVDWTTPETNANIFWDQNVLQMWVPSEFNVSKDLRSWNELNSAERDTYVKVLAGLTGLDTLQANIGMPTLQRKTQDLKSKAVMSFMGMMEQIHAMSYSHIFTTLLSTKETDNLLSVWVPENKKLSRKEEAITFHYQQALITGSTTHWVRLYMGYVASVLLESFLFYSGFYYPLYLAGQGKMVYSGEIIRKILMDEAIHGAFIGLLAQETYQQIDDFLRAVVDAEVPALVTQLLSIEDRYIEELYSDIGLVDEVKNFTRYNLNKALQILGKEATYDTQPVSAIVLNGLNTTTKTHDFFSTKGDGYIKSKNNEDVTDADFIF